MFEVEAANTDHIIESTAAKGWCAIYAEISNDELSRANAQSLSRITVLCNSIDCFDTIELVEDGSLCIARAKLPQITVVGEIGQIENVLDFIDAGLVCTIARTGRELPLLGWP